MERATTSTSTRTAERAPRWHATARSRTRWSCILRSNSESDSLLNFDPDVLSLNFSCLKHWSVVFQKLIRVADIGFQLCKRFALAENAGKFLQSPDEPAIIAPVLKSEVPNHDSIVAGLLLDLFQRLFWQRLFRGGRFAAGHQRFVFGRRFS